MNVTVRTGTAGRADDVVTATARLPAELASVALARRLVDDTVTAVGAPAGCAADVALATTELVANVVRHADATHLEMTVVAVAGAGDVVVSVADDGRWRPPSPTAALATGGRGLVVTRAAVDDLAVDTGPGGTRATFRRRVATP